MKLPRTLKTPPTMKLPTTMPDGKNTSKHPLVYCCEKLLNGHSKSELARAMGVRPQSLYKWLKKGAADRNFSIPLERAILAAKFFNVHPSLFRNDVPWPQEGAQ